MTRPAHAACAFLLAACAGNGNPDHPMAAADAVPVDSIVLERTPCFGTCPAYRVSLAADGTIRFQSHNPGEEDLAAEATTSSARFTALVDSAHALRFDELPAELPEDPRYCANRATDLPSAMVTLHRGAESHRVHDYPGCRIPDGNRDEQRRVDALRRLQLAIDAATESSRWVRPRQL